SGAIPMVGFGAAAYVVALLDRSGVSTEVRDCTAPLMPTDAGADLATVDGEAGADLAMERRGGASGCACEVGGKRRSPLRLALLLWLSLRLARASRVRDREAD